MKSSRESSFSRPSFFPYSVSVGVDACRRDREHGSDVLGSHTDAQICAKTQIVFRQLRRYVLQFSEEVGMHRVEMNLETSPFIIALYAVADK